MPRLFFWKLLVFFFQYLKYYFSKCLCPLLFLSTALVISSLFGSFFLNTHYSYYYKKVFFKSKNEQLLKVVDTWHRNIKWSIWSFVLIDIYSLYTVLGFIKKISFQYVIAFTIFSSLSSSLTTSLPPTPCYVSIILFPSLPLLHEIHGNHFTFLWTS